jgi:outer membrane lipoprotein-sorting protein
MKRKLKLPVLLYFLAGALTACETLPPPKPVEPPAQFLTLDEISRQLAARQEGIHNIKSMVKSSIKTREKNHNLKQVLLIDGESSLRLDTLNLFSQPVGVLISDQTQILLYDTKNNKLYRNREVWDIMLRTFGTVFDFREYVSVFSGRIPRLASLNLKDVRWNPKTGNYQISAVDSERNDPLEIEVDTKTVLPVRLVKWKEGKQVYTVQWEDYRKADGYLFPHTITVQRPLIGDEVVMKFNNPQINQGVPEDAFQLNVPQSP